jgi:hypothetical protein
MLGEIRNNKLGTPMKIIRYKNRNEITIEFMDEHRVQRDTTYQNFKIGQVRNPYDRSVSGVGYDGEGVYKTNTTPFDYSMWQAWKKILLRCYDERFRHKYPAYEGCTVCEEWFCYQNFAEWYSCNYKDFGEGRMHIDKDIIKKNNKVYCPEYCLVLPQRFNMIFVNQPNKYGLPSGISLTQSGKYHASYNGKRLGNFKTLDEAIKSHDAAKRIHIRNLVEEYRNRLTDKVCEALLAW